MSAAAWHNKLSSRNPREQVFIRLLSWWETAYRLRFSAYHVDGVDNVFTDAGSRLSANHSYVTLFSPLTSGWTHDYATVNVQGLTDICRHISELTPLPTPLVCVVLVPWYLYVACRSPPDDIFRTFMLHGFQFGYGSGGPI
ncbi:hypothetical protein PHMEG_00011368 [Phytophthora megakarya]|uniref:Uncharacterized protein n=1 Tax=Phytophthora megakarya TaxID=4795 RepID=A0A225WDX5_9STRA|nr:hypothetical protein PHMEG_00011368 [Phytophthora megakarya]